MDTKSIRRAGLGLVLFLAPCLAASCRAPSTPSGSFERVMANPVEGHQLQYTLRVPDSAHRPQAGWPLLLFLHGAGERGEDLSAVAKHGPLKHVDTIRELGACVLVAPQCPEESWWQSASLGALLDEVCAAENIDHDRVYVTGLSMGGYGTWNLLATYPERFAAAVPICGGGDLARLWSEFESNFELDDLVRANDVPIRAFHGDADEVIPVEESRLLVEALQALGAHVRLTEYPGVGHDSWTQTYSQAELYEWLFAQRR